MSLELKTLMREFMDFEIRELESAYEDISDTHARVVVGVVRSRLLTERARIENRLKEETAFVQAESNNGHRREATGEEGAGGKSV